MHYNSVIMIYCVGDSMLNNARYVGYNQSVLDHLRNISEKENNKMKFTMLAQDGARISDVYSQLTAIKQSDNPITIILSVGGNDLLAEDAEPREQFHQWLNLVNAIQIQFYDSSIKIFVLGLYYPQTQTRFFDRIRQWNQWQKINKYTVISTDDIITESKDICYKIEPSNQGGSKIASKIVNYLSGFNKIMLKFY